MTIRRQSRHARTASASLAVVAVCVAGCSSPPKPAEADGSARVPANDPARVQAVQLRAAADRTLLTENNLLRAQVEVLQQKVAEMTSIVREALTLPPAPAMRSQAAPALRGQPAPTSAAASMLSALPVAVAQALPAQAYSATPNGVVVRVFHGFARTEFQPDELVAQALRSAAREAQHIEVRGHTDSGTGDAANRRVAAERAAKARDWLLANGVDGSRIRIEIHPAGHFLADNRTPDGRALNRRVEIEFYTAGWATNRVALSH